MRKLGFGYEKQGGYKILFRGQLMVIKLILGDHNVAPNSFLELGAFFILAHIGLVLKLVQGSRFSTL